MKLGQEWRKVSNSAFFLMVLMDVCPFQNRKNDRQRLEVLFDFHVDTAPFSSSDLLLSCSLLKIFSNKENPIPLSDSSI
jgi:hypothetical protein